MHPDQRVIPVVAHPGPGERHRETLALTIAMARHLAFKPPHALFDGARPETSLPFAGRAHRQRCRRVEAMADAAHLRYSGNRTA